LLVDDAILHHKLHTSQGRDITCRNTLHCDQIRKQSILHPTNLLFHVKYTRVD